MTFERVEVGPHILYRGDCREVLPTLAAGSVHCCVTSPPYWGLRYYGAGGIGNEPLLEDYTTALVRVFREVRRVLRTDGTLWLNMGDAYSSGGRRTRDGGSAKRRRSVNGYEYADSLRPPDQPGVKALDLLGLPWRVALALQADGWLLRSANVWAKQNPLPESVAGWRWEPHRVRSADGLAPCPGCSRCSPQDGLVLRKGAWRSTSSYDMVFMFSVSGTYFADGEELREPATGRPSGNKASVLGDGYARPGHHRAHSIPYAGGESRNMRNVWTFPTAPFSGAHFATFPPELPRRCILAGTSAEGCCPTCGAPHARVIERAEIPRDAEPGKYGKASSSGRLALARDALRARGNSQDNPFEPSRTIGWRPTCACPPAGTVPCTVLDPFAGAGTTGLVADRLGRNAILVEFNGEYTTMAEARIAGPELREEGEAYVVAAEAAGQLRLIE